MKRRANDLLVHFERPHTSDGPTGAIDGRVENPRGTALGFRNLTHHFARNLLNSGNFRRRLHTQV